MKTLKRSVAAAELILIFPALLFMTALFVRELTPLQLEPARTAAHIITWYASHPRIGLWLLLVALPFAVLVTGGAALRQSWNTDAELRHAAQSVLAALRAHWAAFFVLAATAASGIVLAIVALHMATN